MFIDASIKDKQALPIQVNSQYSFVILVQLKEMYSYGTPNKSSSDEVHKWNDTFREMTLV